MHDEYVVIQNEKQKYSLVNLRSKYQSWYTRSLRVIQQLLPDRLTEFESLYMHNRKERTSSYTISDFLNNLVVPYHAGQELRYFIDSLHMQYSILSSASTRIDSILSDAKGVLRADLFDDELSKARELLKNGYLRPAGVLVGVVLESHLTAVCDNHLIKITKAKPTLADYNDGLKNAGVYDVSQWRQIQWLGDIRNKCAHNGTEPTGSEVQDLISGVEKVVKMIH